MAQSPQRQIDLQIQDQDTYDEHSNAPEAHGPPLLLDECADHCHKMNKFIRSCNDDGCICTSVYEGFGIPFDRN